MKRKNHIKGSAWEIYDKQRYLTVTGFALAEPPTRLPAISQGDIKRYQSEFMGTRLGVSDTLSHSKHLQYEMDFASCDLSADDLRKISDMRTILSELDQLWEGDWQSIQNEGGSQKYPSHSEADLGFCNQLAKILGEPSKVVAAWKKSGLWRPHKCERRPDYVPRTVEKAFQQLAAENKIEFLILVDRDGELSLKQIAPSKAAEAFLQDFGGKLLFVDSQFYNYKKDLGTWSLEDEHVITSRIEHFLEKAVEHYQPTAVLSDKVVKDTVSFLSRLKEVGCNSESHVWNPKSYILVLGNGVIDLNQNVFDLQPFDHELYSTFRSPINYYQQAKCPNWQRFLDRVIPDKDDQLRIQEWAGYLLYPSTKLEKILFLYGSGRNGKSTFIETITALVDPNEISHVEPQNLAREYDIAALQHKRINVVADITTDKQTSGVFKQLVSRERLQARNPYRPSFSFTPCVKLLFSSNFLPQTHDRSEGFYRRWDILKFDKQLKESEVDLDLKTKLRVELPGISLWTLTGLKRLKENDWRMTAAPGFNDGIESLKQYTDVFKDFLDTHYQISENIKNDLTGQPYVKWEGLYRKYKYFCEENGLSKMSGKKVEQELIRFGCKKSQKRIGEERDGTGQARKNVV
ncbi:MAG: phage/plasmid primase, P4 family, partial [SAR324 cluster bacterium]|nr:phage/plasmid primase, P4 family [SAR324 cluster bacterium]